MITHHTFLIEDANKYGVNASIILQHIEFFCLLNKNNNRNFKDGHYWTYITTKAFKRTYSYLGEKQIRNAIKILKNAGVIITANYNKKKFDQTLWYASTRIKTEVPPAIEDSINEDNLDELDQDRRTSLDERANQDINRGEPIPVINNSYKLKDNNIYSNPVASSHKPTIKTSSDAKRITTLISFILEKWNEKKLKNCKGTDQQLIDISKTLKKARYKLLTKEDYDRAFKNYETILNDPKSFFNYRWSLPEFLKRETTLKFYEDDFDANNYIKSNDKHVAYTSEQEEIRRKLREEGLL